MSGEGHRLKATASEDGGVSVIIASVEGELLAKINAEITQQIELRKQVIINKLKNRVEMLPLS
ncbi:MAG: hypothetical protein J7604_11460 [Sporocytophaga sp.]|uniref:hypothetical protein n=1 Tax=Sporocytophaga sp. TaxID=2231183 RepID=UPI001B10563A|nr:hypothetical protein [Sporocytophaga sp.]MBO9700818.1 hypothetical protein [Sporocytophaga sp.]